MAAAAPCPAVTPQVFYRFVTGIDTCMQPLSSQEQAQLNDPYAVMLKKNQKGAGPWPNSVAAVVSAVGVIPNIQPQVSYVLGEGSQVPPSVTPTTSNRNLRYVVTWLMSGGSTPVVFLSSRPDSTQPIFLQVIGYDATKKAFNYYQYVSNSDVVPGDPGTVQTWSYAGDSSNAFNSATTGQACFACHRNGGLNMKELQVPWNNWSSQLALIPPTNVPAAMTTDPLFVNAQGADQLELVTFQPIMNQYMTDMVSSSISNGQVSQVSTLLRRLVTNTTINFRSSQVQSRPSAFPPLNIPSTLVLNDELLGSTGIGLGYTVPPLNVSTSTYNGLVSSRNYNLINGPNSRPPIYKWPGDNFFSFFYPEPAFEDVAAVTQLWTQNVIAKPFAASVLMVDYPNPVFSLVRDTLLQYSSQLSTGKADGTDIPNQFAALVSKAAASQPVCNSTDLTKCTAEQQFVAYWTMAQKPNWQTAFVNVLNPYLAAVGTRMGTPAGVADYMTLTTSRQEQFQNYPGICNLYEFDLFLPCNSEVSLDFSKFYTMNSDGTISPQPGYTCPTRTSWTNPCVPK
jgi:hypothetical protein